MACEYRGFVELPLWLQARPGSGLSRAVIAIPLNFRRSPGVLPPYHGTNPWNAEADANKTIPHQRYGTIEMYTGIVSNTLAERGADLCCPALPICGHLNHSGCYTVHRSSEEAPNLASTFTSASPWLERRKLTANVRIATWPGLHLHHRLHLHLHIVICCISTIRLVFLDRCQTSSTLMHSIEASAKSDANASDCLSVSRSIPCLTWSPLLHVRKWRLPTRVRYHNSPILE